jgi:hypothetical protein
MLISLSVRKKLLLLLFFKSLLGKLLNAKLKRQIPTPP